MKSIELYDELEKTLISDYSRATKAAYGKPVTLKDGTMIVKCKGRVECNQCAFYYPSSVYSVNFCAFDTMDWDHPCEATFNRCHFRRADEVMGED